MSHEQRNGKNTVAKMAGAAIGVSALVGYGPVVHHEISQSNEKTHHESERYARIIEPAATDIAESALTIHDVLGSPTKTSSGEWRQIIVSRDHGKNNGITLTYKTDDDRRPTPADVSRIQINLGLHEDTDSDRSIIINADEAAEAYEGTHDRWFISDSAWGTSDFDNHTDVSLDLDTARTIVHGVGDVAGVTDVADRIIQQATRQSN